jgi:hypothetical protein
MSIISSKDCIQGETKMAIKIYDRDLIVAVDTEEEFKTVLRVLKGIDTQLPLTSHTPNHRASRRSSGNPFDQYWNRLIKKEHRITLTTLYQSIDGLSDVQLRNILGLPSLNNKELAGVMTGLSKHAMAVGLEFNSQVISKEITGKVGQRSYYYTLANPMRQYMETLSNLEQVSLPDNDLGAENASQPLIPHNGEHAERTDFMADLNRYGSDHET